MKQIHTTSKKLFAMKKLTALLLLTAFLLSFVSCSGNSDMTDSDTSGDTGKQAESTFCDTTDIPPTVESSQNRILDDDGFVRTSSGVLCLDTEYNTAYKQLIKGLPIYLAYTTNETFYLSHDVETLIPEKYTSYGLYYECNESKTMYTIHLMLIKSSYGSARAYVITYDATSDKYTVEPKYTLSETLIASDGSYYASMPTDVNGYTIDYDDKSPSCVLNEKFEFIVTPGTLEHGEYYPFVGRTDIIAKNNEITEECGVTVTVTADGKQYIDHGGIGSPLMNVAIVSCNTEYVKFDLFAKKTYTVGDTFPSKSSTIGSTLDFEVPNYDEKRDKPNNYVYRSRNIAGEKFETVVDSDGENIYYGCSYNGKIIVEPVYTSIVYSISNTSLYFMILMNENGMIIVNQEMRSIKIYSFDEYVYTDSLLYVKRADGKWGTISPYSKLFAYGLTAYDFIYDDVKYEDVAIFTCHDENGEVYYRVNEIDEKFASVESEGYRIKVKTTDGEEFYMAESGYGLCKIIYDR